MSSEEESECMQGKHKKGSKNTFLYKANVIKRSRVKCGPYKNWTGKEVLARQPGKDCK